METVSNNIIGYLLLHNQTAEQYATLDDIPGGVLVSIYKK